MDDAVGKESSAVDIDIVVDETLGYASWQNHVPLVRSIAITNTTGEALEDVNVTVTMDPPVADPYVIRFERLGALETRRISPVDVRCHHQELASRTELERALLRVVAMSGEAALGRAAREVELLAYDQWAGTRALPELLAAFCTPNDPLVDQLLGRAAQALAGRQQLNGYQSELREQVLLQIAALYGAIAAERYSYSNPPASFGKDGQKIRTPERIAAGRIATCLDTTLLFASCLEQIGLNPVVLLMKSHAWVGCWLTKQAFPVATVDDVQTMRKRVDSGELITLETTLVTQQPAGPFRAAIERGREHLELDGEFEFAIDIAAARERRILPLPSRVQAIESPPAEGAVAHVDDLPELPPLPPGGTRPNITVPDVETPAGRIARWESKLLDLTLRNRLLNFKPTASSVELVVPDSGELAGRLAADDEFRLEPQPDLMTGTDPRDSKIHNDRTGDRALDELARDLIARRKLLALVDGQKFNGRLLEIFTNAELSEQEGGSNTLFLAMGFLQWKEADAGERSYLAPVLLIPVSLKRRSVHSGYVLKRHDDETLVNPTLLQMLQRNEDLTIRGLDPVPMKGEAVDVERVWAAFRSAITNIGGWELNEKCFLGIFSFTKYLMWKDLHSRLADLKQNRVVARLVDNTETPYEGADVGRDKSLDELYAPQALFAPKLADSSQLRAVAMAERDCDFVLDGPPGTGKSQTITNIIADSLAKGKTVLFVSEKIAALNVVRTRLEEVGLGPFCLELHSAKAKKTEVMKQLGHALEFSGGHTAEAWQHEAGRLAALRMELNELVRALHRVHPNGLTVYEASGRAILNSHRAPGHFEWTDADTHHRVALDGLRDVVKRIAALADEFSSLKGHGLDGIARTNWSNAWEADLFREVGQLDGIAAELEQAYAAATAACGIEFTSPSFARLMAFDTLADVLLRARGVPMGLAPHACDQSVQSTLRKLRTHGEQRRQVWASFHGYRESVASLDGTSLGGQWRVAHASWWPRRWFAERAVANIFRAHREDLRRPNADQTRELVEQLARLNEEDRAIKATEPAIGLHLGDTYQGVKTDWSALSRHEAWCKAFEDATARFAGSDVAGLGDIRGRLSTIVGQHQHVLEPQQQTGASLLHLREAYRNFAARIKSVEDLVGRGPLTGHADEAAAVSRVRSALQRWTSARRQIRTWCQWQGIRSHAIAQGLSGLVAALEAGGVAVDEVVDFFEFSYQTWWMKRVVDREPVLLNFVSKDHDRKIRDFRDADARFEQLTRKYIVAKLAQRVPNTNLPAGEQTELGKLRRALQRQRGLAPIRQVLSDMPTLLPKLKPCLLMSPLSVAQYLDATHKFDLVVFDEASQIPVWDAVGAIARGKQLAVAGDQMQLPPTSFFQKAYDSEDNIAEDEVQDLESVLDECLAVGLPRQRLEWHYRSRHEALIAFSNMRYYDDDLITFPSPITNDKSVLFRHVRGTYDRGGAKTNRAEADAIVREIEEHYLDERRRGKSMGVVTFNQPQMSLIQSLLESRRGANPKLDAVLAEIDEEPLFIKNLENVQGDERDVILFSITYGPDAAGKITMQMGPLIKEGGHRRLNVAITRAREQVVLFSTLLPEHIDTARASGQGVADLKAYLDFARRGKVALLAQSSPTGLDPDSPFEIAVISALREKGWTVHPQVGCSGYRVDIGVVNPEVPGEYLMGVECDGATYHSAASARDRDRLRQLVLERLGWSLHRIWSTDWWNDREKEVERLDRVLKERLAARAKGEAVPISAPLPKSAVDDAREAETDTPLPPGHPQRELYARAPAPAAASPRTAARLAPDLSVYARHELRTSKAKRFDDRFSDGSITEQILELVNAEGPISEDEVFRRIARAWGIERVGNRVAERIALLRPSALGVTKAGGRFYWPSSTDPIRWRGFRVAADDNEDSKRHIDQVALEEIANAAAYLLENSGVTPSATLAKDVCRFFGMARISVDAQNRAKKGIQLLIRSGRAQMDAETECLGPSDKTGSSN